MVPAKSVRNIRSPLKSRAIPIPSIKCVSKISGTGRLLKSASIDARFTVLPRGGSPRSVQYNNRFFRSSSRSIGSGRPSNSCSISEIGVYRRAVHRVTARWISAVGPIQQSLFQIELEIDWFRQTIEQLFDV